MNTIDLHQGDAIALLDQLLSSGQRWDYCLTSPPYWKLIDYGHELQIGHEPIEDYLDLLTAVFERIYQGMNQKGVLWLNFGDTYNNYSTITQGGRRQPRTGRRKPIPGYKVGELIPVGQMLVNRLRGLGWVHRETLIWHQGNRSHQPAGRPAVNYEHIYILGKHEISRPKLDYEPTGSSVIFEFSEPHPDHPCRMAQRLADCLAQCGTRETATLIDPFCGTGTSLIAARRRGWDAIGIDLDTSIAAEATKYHQGSLPWSN